MEEVKIQDVLRKLRERQGVLSEEEIAALFAHFDSLAGRIRGLESMLAEARAPGETSSPDPKAKGRSSHRERAGKAKRPGKQEVLHEYGMLYEALKHARPTAYEDGEAHQIHLNQIAALAACAAELYAQGIAIGNPLHLSTDEEDEEDERERSTTDVWSEIAQESLFTNETILVLSAYNADAYEAIRASMRAVFRRMGTGEPGPVPYLQSVVEIDSVIPWSEKPAEALFHQMIESMGIWTIMNDLDSAKDQYRGENMLRAIAGNDFLAQVLECIHSPIRYSHDSPDREKLHLVQALLGEGCTQSERRKLGIPRNLTLQDRYQLLSALIQVRTGTPLPHGREHHTRVWLWLDRLENILHYSPKEINDFVNGLSTVLTTIPALLTVCCNIADPHKETQAKVIQALGPRVTEHANYQLVQE